jgi:hypothetical protein
MTLVVRTAARFANDRAAGHEDGDQLEARVAFFGHRSDHVSVLELSGEVPNRKLPLM